MIRIIGVLYMPKLYSVIIRWSKITAPALNANVKEKSLKILLPMIKSTGKENK